MIRIGRIVVAVPFIAGLAGCAAAASLPDDPAELVAALGDVVAEDSLETTAPGWAIEGTARLVDVPSFSVMMAQVEASGLTPGPHAWHIHAGGCESAGAVVVAFTAIGDQLALDEPLVADETGQASQDAIVPPDRLSEEQVLAGDYSLHIHNAAGSNPGRSVACASF